ncbi:MAG: tRNA 2-thiouridine(34) synthase MnmA, partial [Clostridia bacterium]|nr:tRNA 2-thiouridine(34) synthase MnmA [Clostridia bacterium]
TEPFTCTARTRYRQKEKRATAYPLEDGRIRVVFDEPQRAVTPGQSAVLYDGDTVLAGGIIE